MTASEALVFQHSSFAGRIGVAREDITPPVGICHRNWGASETDTARTVHRPLTLTALTVAADQDSPPLVLVSADLGWWQTPELFSVLQQRVLSALNLDASRFLFALTHTHAGPVLADASADLPGADLRTDYFDRLCDAAISSVRQAEAAAVSAVLDWHTGCCRLAACRDLPDPTSDGERIVCGFRPGAPADDTLLVGRVTDQTGTIRAVLVNYACHPTTLAWENTALSPDFVGTMRDVVEEQVGGPVLFIQGASAELAPRYQYTGSTETADRHGRHLGHAVLATLFDMEPPASRLVFDRIVESGAPLAVWSHEPRTVSSVLRAVQTTVDLPLKNWPAADELDQRRQACDDRAVRERLRRQRDIRRVLGDGCTHASPVWIWRLGDALLAASFWECYSTLQRQLRHRFPERCVVFGGLVNGSLGYLPPAALYETDAYPVWQTPVAAGGLERMTDCMMRTAADLLAGDLPDGDDSFPDRSAERSS